MGMSFFIQAGHVSFVFDLSLPEVFSSTELHFFSLPSCAVTDQVVDEVIEFLVVRSITCSLNLAATTCVLWDLELLDPDIEHSFRSKMNIVKLINCLVITLYSISRSDSVRNYVFEIIELVICSCNKISSKTIFTKIVISVTSLLYV